MSYPESFSPSGGAAPAGPDPGPGPFTGQARDLPAPFESPGVPAVHLLAPAPADRAWPDTISGFREAIAEEPGEARPMVPAETAFRLQELATALTLPAAVPRSAASIQTEPAAEEAVSLATLAHQLQSRFTTVEPDDGGPVDLMEEPAAAVPFPAGLPVAAESPAPAGLGLAALLPSLGVKPSAPALAPAAPAITSPSPPAGPARIALPPPARPQHPATARQGDVFFMEPPPALTAPEEPEEDGPDDLFEDDPGGGLAGSIDLPELSDPAPAAVSPAAAPGLHAPPPLPPPAPADEGSASGLGLVLGGAALILLGIYFACQLPIHWLNQTDGPAWDRRNSMAALVVHAAAALTALTLGTGSLMQRRWAPPLIHAAGWIAVLTASGVMAVTVFQLVGAETDTALPGPGSLIALLASLLLPLGCIFYYQQESAAAVCEAEDPSPAWTDGLPVPALMVFLTGLALAAGAAAMLCHQPAFALALQPPLTGAAATAAWICLLALGLGIAISARLKHGSAPWLLLLAALLSAAAFSPAAFLAGEAWQAFLTALGHHAPARSAGPLVPLLTALLPAPLLLVFAMARRSFSSAPTP